MADMDLPRALNIVARINNQAFLAMGLIGSDQVETTAAGMSLEGISLAELMEATTVVKAHNAAGGDRIEGGSRMYTVPDDRLIAAAYVAAHYDADPDNNIVFYPILGNGQDRVMTVRVIDLLEVDDG